MIIVNRKDIDDEYFLEILDTETHHDHEIIKDGGVLRWKEDPVIRDFISYKISLNDLITELYELGYDKNSEIYRKLYRDMGYSLNGYWETFYWDANNSMVAEYNPNKTI